MCLTSWKGLFASLSAFLLIVCCAALYSQEQTAAPPVKIPTSWMAEWRDATVSFGTITNDAPAGKYYKVMGSGIVVSEVNAQRGYILTAKHVFLDPLKKWHPSEIQIRYGWQDQKSVYSELGTTIKLRDDTGKDLWTALDDGSDLAAIPAPPAVRALQPSINPAGVASPDRIFEGANIIALGYPGIVGNEYLVRAISRGGIIAWTDPKDPSGKRFLIDANIYPGNSGGPVISNPITSTAAGGLAHGAQPVLLGIVVEAPGQSGEFDLAVPGQRAHIKIRQEIPLGGTGVVEPASEVRKLLDLVMK
jgi:hypothetical protein